MVNFPLWVDFRCATSSNNGQTCFGKLGDNLEDLANMRLATLDQLETGMEQDRSTVSCQSYKRWIV